MTRPADHYETLMVPGDAGAAVIRTAFRRLIAECHPDRVPGRTAHDRATALIAAYRILSDPARRLAYDTERRRSGNRRAAGMGTPPATGERRRQQRRRPSTARSWSGALNGAIGLWAILSVLAIGVVSHPLIVPADRLDAVLVHSL